MPAIGAETERDWYHAVVSTALRLLSVDELAQAVGVHVRQVRRWAAKDHRPYGRARATLSALSELLDALEFAFSEPDAKLWLHRPNVRLGGCSPVEALAFGELGAVMSAAWSLSLAA